MAASLSWGGVFALGLSVTLISAAFLLNRVPSGSRLERSYMSDALHDTADDHKRMARKRDSKLLVATRIHGTSSSSMPSVDSVINFVKHSHIYASKVLICIGIKDQDPSNSAYIMRITDELKKQNLFSEVTLLPITPWGQFTFALNCAIAYARDAGFDLIAFQSLELKIDATVARHLAAYVASNHNVIVAGPVISGHEFSEGVQTVRGRTIPWNTFAVWSLRELSLTGFPLIGDGYPVREDAPAIPGGVEEVAAINLLQSIDPRFTAVLVLVENNTLFTNNTASTGGTNKNNTNNNISNVPDATATAWETQFDDPKRREYHENKMRSKDERPAAQMKELGISSGNVLHIPYDRLTTTSVRLE